MNHSLNPMHALKFFWLSLFFSLILTMPASLAIAQCDPAPNISVDWEYNINNDVEDGNDIAYDIEAIDDASDGDSEPDNGYIVVGSTETDDNLKQA